MKSKIIVSLSLAGLLLFFQNCGNVRFADTVSSQGSAKLTGLSLEENEQDMGDVATGLVQQPSAPEDQGKKNNIPANPAPVIPDTTVTVADQPSDDPPSVIDDPPVEAPGDTGDLVACILKDHGKSLKLGLIEEQLGGVHSVARSVCISRKGCLELVAAKFEVEGAYDRGYCKGNPNVVRLTDAQLTELLK